MWQLALLGLLVFGTVAYISRRSLMKGHDANSRLFNLIFWMLFFGPSALVIGQFFPHNLVIGWENYMLLLLGGLFWPLVGLVGFRANREVDTGFYAIVTNLSPVVTIVLAVTLLRETVTVQQAVGMTLLILSGFVASIPLVRAGSRASRYGLMLCLLVVVIGGAGLAYEKWMLSRIDLGTYILVGWTAQTLWMLLLARHELKNVTTFFRVAERKTRRYMVVFSLANIARTVCFLLALSVAPASVVSSATNFLAVTVLLASYFFLHERDYLSYKVTAAFVGIAGLFLVS